MLRVCVNISFPEPQAGETEDLTDEVRINELHREGVPSGTELIVASGRAGAQCPSCPAAPESQLMHLT